MTIADRQHGVVARRQLTEAGMGRDAVRHRLEHGRLHPVHRGVYAVGHRALTTRGRWMAAVLAAGPGAVLSHRSAAALWGIRSSDTLEVTAPAFRTRPGIRIHTSPLPADEVTTLDAIPVTGVPRTLLDLASVLRPHQLERALNEAEVQRLTDPLSLSDLITRHPGRRGVAKLRPILARLETASTFTRSELEARFLDFARRVRLPPPALNVHLLGLECDCVWPDQRLVVELDGHAAHGTSAAFERDRSRDRMLHAAGWRVVRITWRQLHQDPEVIAADLRKLLFTPRSSRPRRSARSRAADP